MLRRYSQLQDWHVRHLDVLISDDVTDSETEWYRVRNDEKEDRKESEKRKDRKNTVPVRVPIFPSKNWWSALTDKDGEKRVKKLQKYFAELMEMCDDPMCPEKVRRAVDELFEVHFLGRWVMLGNFEMVKYLVEVQNVQVHARDPVRGTPLHYAVACNNVEMVEYFLSKDASPYVMDNMGLTPYGIAIMMKNQIVIELFNHSLVKRGIPLPLLAGSESVFLEAKDAEEKEFTVLLKKRSIVPVHYRLPMSKRLYLFLINPFGGTKLGPLIWTQIVEKIFDLVGLNFEKMETTHSGHAAEIAAALDLNNFHAIITISGDGLFHEVLNGLGSRPDAEIATQFPIGVIPAGSGNGLAASLGWKDAESACISLARGFARPLDLLVIQQPSQNIRVFACMLFMWGLIADIDFQSEEFRWIGVGRFTVMALKKVLENSLTYRCRLHYLPSVPPSHYFDFHHFLPAVKDAFSLSPKSIAHFFSPVSNDFPDRIPTVCMMRFCRRCQVGASQPVCPKDVPPIFLTNPFAALSTSASHSGTPLFRPSADMLALKPLIDRFVPPSSKWVTVDDSLDFFLVGNVSRSTSESLSTPSAHFSDGSMDLVYSTHQSRLETAQLLLGLDSGDHITIPSVTYVKASHLVLEPIDDSLIDVDGERYPNITSFVSVQQGHVSLLC